MKNIQQHAFFRNTTTLQYFVAILDKLNFMKKQKNLIIARFPTVFDVLPSVHPLIDSTSMKF